ARLRDREGLAYTVRANITSSAGEHPGTFSFYIGTDPEHFARVRKEFLEELKRLRDEKPEAGEGGDAREILLGRLPFRFTTNEEIAGELLLVERYKLGFGYLDEYRKAVAAVTPEDVQAVARKHLDPQALALVAAGPVDAKGNVVKSKPKPESKPD